MAEAPGALAGQRSKSLPGLGAAAANSQEGWAEQQKKPAERPGGQLKGWLPHLDRGSFIYGVGFETCRRNDCLENMDRYRAEGDLPRLWAAVRRAKLDAHLDDSPTVNEMHRILAAATKQKVICENVARRLTKSSFSVKDVGVLGKAIKELEELKLGPKLWKDPMYPLLHLVVALLPHREKLRRLVQQYRAGCAQYCAAWLAAVDSGELSFSFELEVSTARWLLAFPDAADRLGGAVSDDVKAEYWRLTESMESTGVFPDASSRLSPKDAHLVNLLAKASFLVIQQPCSKAPDRKTKGASTQTARPTTT